MAGDSSTLEKNMDTMTLEETTATEATPTTTPTATTRRSKSRPAAPGAPPTHDAAALLLEVEAEHAKLVEGRERAEARLRAMATRGMTKPERDEGQAALKAALLALEVHGPLLAAARQAAGEAEERARHAEGVRAQAEQEAALVGARGRVDEALERADAALAAFEAAGVGVVEALETLTQELTALFNHPRALPWRAEARTKRLVQVQTRLMLGALGVLADGLGKRAGEATGHPFAKQTCVEAHAARRRVLEVRGL